MPSGPQSQWRPADLIAWAVHVDRIATGEIHETYEAPRANKRYHDSRRLRGATCF